MANKKSIDRVSVYVAAGFVSGCGALMFNVMPVFVGALSKSLGYGESRLGDLVALFNVGFTLSALSATVWVRSFDWQRVSLLGVVIASVCLGLMALYNTLLSLGALMVFTGVGMGGLYSLILAILGDSENPDRAFGVKLGLETLPGALLLFLFPIFVVPAFGFTGVAVGMAAVALALGLFSFLLPHSGVKSDPRQGQTRLPKRSGYEVALPLIGLACSLLFFTGIASTWAFLELLAAFRSIPPETVGTTLAIAFIICGLGGFAAAAISDRFGRQVPVVGIIVVNLVGLWYLSRFVNGAEYALGASLFLFSVNFTLAYTFGLTAQVDVSGKLVVLSAACLSLGAIVGPAIAGRLVEFRGYDFMLGFSAACSLGALSLYLLLVRLQRATIAFPSARTR